jgi:hypothetical protein
MLGAHDIVPCVYNYVDGREVGSMDSAASHYTRGLAGLARAPPLHPAFVIDVVHCRTQFDFMTLHFDTISSIYADNPTLLV